MALATPAPEPDALLALRGIAWTTTGRAAAIGVASDEEAFEAEATLSAIDPFDLALPAGAAVGVVGESRSGISTVGRLSVGLLAPSAGDRYFDGERVTDLRAPAARRVRLATQMLFPDGRVALDPRRRVVDLVGAAAVVHGVIGARQRVEYAGLMLNRVGIDPLLMRRRPYEFSAAQRIRIGIARALAVRPRVLVCADVMAELDVSARAPILNLLVDVRAALDLSYLVLGRDPDNVRYIADRMLVMYQGRVIESAVTHDLYARPNHPYTQALLRRADPAASRRHVPIVIAAATVSEPARGCPYQPRCPVALPRCRDETPALVEVAPGHHAACHLNAGG